MGGCPQTGDSNTNNGNIEAFYEDPETASDITEVDVNLIQRLEVF